MIHPKDIEALDQAFTDLASFAAGIRDSPSDAPWFREMLAAFLEAAAAGYGHLRLGLTQSTGLLAWACRNLLELNIYTQYALHSESNAQRISLNRVAEGLDTLDSFKTWLARNDASLATPEIDAEMERLSVLKAQEEDLPPRLYSVKYLAAEVGLADEYANMTKIAGKLAQPGIFTIMSREWELEPMRPPLFRAGAGHGMEIYQAARQHFSVFGAAPKP